MKSRLGLGLIGLVSCVLCLVSCQKVIDINLNNAAPNIVIEGNVYKIIGNTHDINLSCTVKISESVNYDVLNVFPPVSGAKVIISDNTGHSDTLKETSQGNYTNSRVQGVEGNTYTLNVVTSDGKTYSGTSTMPFAVNIDTLKEIKEYSFRGDITRNVDVIYQDPANISNYYRFVKIINGKTSKNLMLSSDRLYDGGLETHTVRNDPDSVHLGDSVVVLLESIDSKVYEYFRELNQIVNGGGQQTSPANPVTNLNNGALGYFSASAITSKRIKLKQ